VITPSTTESEYRQAEHSDKTFAFLFDLKSYGWPEQPLLSEAL
jgi:hypothetical protein